jgi:ABC-type branched-subunit amino acid transport system ATPase component
MDNVMHSIDRRSGSGSLLLEVRDVVKKFGGLVANNGISLSLANGEVRGLIGPNGSGKTTLINLITGMYEVTSGSIHFSGRRIDGLQPDMIASLGIMRTFQVAKVFREMTVLENMLIPAFCQGQSRREARARADELLEFALLTRLKDKPAKSLSGGQNMLLQIVRGFMHKNLQLYVMDEPFAGVHQSIKGIILDSIRWMNSQKGVTFLVISHEMPTISNLCSKVTVLSRGERIAEGTLEEVAGDPQVIDAYLGG